MPVSTCPELQTQWLPDDGAQQTERTTGWIQAIGCMQCELLETRFLVSWVALTKYRADVT
jgi:lipid-A-disaccharide synthase-like uncharacterized protein